MSLSIGIVGLPNVGKSSLFNALTKNSVPSENYPFCTIDPSVGVVEVPDDRLQELAKISGSEKIIPTIVEFTDIAGLVKGASKGEGLGNKFLANIREVDAIAHVVRIFEDPEITHVHGTINPADDISIINMELIMADAETVTKRLGSISKELRTGNKDIIAENDLLIKIDAVLQQGMLVNSLTLDEKEQIVMKRLSLLTSKPVIYVLNKSNDKQNIDELNDGRWEELLEYFRSTNSLYVKLDANIENEIAEMTDEEKKDFRKEEEGLDVLIKKGYEILGLITYFTTGEKETRAWTTKFNSTAPEAGSAIHSDFQHKFIRAEIVKYDDLIDAGSYAKVRERGQLKIVGKEHIVLDGDVIEFRV